MSFEFHLTVHARPIREFNVRQIELAGVCHPTLDVTTVELDAPIPISFEQAMERLEQLPCMFCELDGSFVWAIHEPQRRWQVDGHLFDRHGKLIYVELHGSCPWPSFLKLLECLGSTDTNLVYQLVREGVIVSHDVLANMWH